MLMRWIQITAISALLVFGCGKPMAPEEKIRRLESQRLEVMADLHRDMAECQAQAIELANSPNQSSAFSRCMEAYLAGREASMLVISSLDKQISKIDSERLKNNPFNQFDDPKKITAEEFLDQKPNPSNLIPFNGNLDAEK